MLEPRVGVVVVVTLRDFNGASCKKTKSGVTACSFLLVVAKRSFVLG